MPHQKKKEIATSTPTRKNTRRITGEDRRRQESGNQSEKKTGEKSCEKKFEGEQSSSKPVSFLRPLSSTQRSSRPQAQPQVIPSLDRFPFVRDSTKCSALREKNGFLFSKKELNYWQTCQRSSSQPECQKWNAENSFLGHWKPVMSREIFPTADRSLSRRPRQPQSTDSIWAWRPSINGHGVPQEMGRASHKNRAWRPRKHPPTWRNHG